jgi:hypothetical protein
MVVRADLNGPIAGVLDMHFERGAIGVDLDVAG